MTTASTLVIVTLVLGTLVVHLGNYYLRQQKDWRAKGLLIVGCVLALGIAAQYYINYELAAPRTLNDKERNRIAEKMKEFAGQEYTGWVAPGVLDAWMLWREIGSSLDMAGWKIWCCVSRPTVQLLGHEASVWQAPSGGVRIFWPTINPSEIALPQEELDAKALRADRMRPAAQALAKALTVEGLPAFGGPIAEIPNHPVVVVAIGPKP
jgi:hypothetical protein